MYLNYICRNILLILISCCYTVVVACVKCQPFNTSRTYYLYLSSITLIELDQDMLKIFKIFREIFFLQGSASLFSNIHNSLNSVSYNWSFFSEEQIFKGLISESFWCSSRKLSWSNHDSWLLVLKEFNCFSSKFWKAFCQVLFIVKSVFSFCLDISQNKINSATKMVFWLCISALS